MSVTRRSIANDLAETAHALLKDEGLEMILERIDKSVNDIVEIHVDAEMLKDEDQE